MSARAFWPEKKDEQEPSCGLACRLCGLAASPSIFLTVEGRQVHFCCPGCLYVFEILRNGPEGVPEDCSNSELYKACVAAGLIRHGQGESRGPEPSAREMDDIRQGLSHELLLRIEGMWCIACSWLLEHLLGKIDGVISANVFFFSDTAHVRYMPHLTGPRAIAEAIERLGYRAAPFETGPEGARGERFALRLGIAAILTMNVMTISFGLYGGFIENIGRKAAALLSCSLWAMATPVVFYCGLPILNRALRSVLHRSATMDSLSAVSVLSAYFYSVIAIFCGSIHVYFDTASMLITFVLLGRFIELRAKDRVCAGITALFQAASGKARLVRDSSHVWIAAEKVLPGDRFLVEPGERVVVDGFVVSGKALVDESMITGESRPVEKEAGSEVPAGALLLGGSGEFEAVRSGLQSSLSQMAALVREALSKKNDLERLADRAMRFLVPFVLLCAGALTLILLAFSVPVQQALLRALTVLVITCPCALGIAAPLARVSVIARARASGILIRNPAALEKAGLLDVIVFDKTGTITEGNYGLREVVAPEGEDDALLRVASAESKSDHFLAREILRAARERGIEPGEPLSFEAFEGMGVAAMTTSGEVIAGNRSLISLHRMRLPAQIDASAARAESLGATVVFFAWNGSVRGYLSFRDKVRETASETLSVLRKAGISLWLVSGDSECTTAAVARELGFENHVGQALPEDKAKIITGLQKKGLTVAMAGDGINDGAALAQSDIGIAVGAGANLVRECSDGAIVGDNLRKIPELLGMSRFSSGIIRQNLFFASFYNLLAIPLAAAGMLNPPIAALAMFASSATVVSNSLRISRYIL